MQRDTLKPLQSFDATREMHLIRLGIILSNLSIVCGVLSQIAVLSAFLPIILWLFFVMYALLIILLIAVTLGAVFAFWPTVWTSVESFYDFIYNYDVDLSWMWQTFAPIAAVLALTALLLLIRDKQERHPTRRTLAIATMIIQGIVLVAGIILVVAT